MKKKLRRRKVFDYYTDPRRPLWPHFAGMLLPLAICGYALFFLIPSVRAQFWFETTEGVVANIEQDIDNSNRERHFLTVAEYKVGVRHYECQARVWLPWWLGHHRGESVTVRYDPNDPSSALIDSFFESWLFPGMILGAGLFTWLKLLRVLLRRIQAGRDVARGKKENQ